MTVSPAEAPSGPRLAWSWKAVVLADVFESTRLSRTDPEDYARRWTAFVDDVLRKLLPARGGICVRSTGDGLLLSFEHAPSAAAAALDLHRRINPLNDGCPAARLILLRVGVNAGDVAPMDKLDIIGSAVDVAQRLMTLGRPGETIVSAEVRDLLVPGIDAEAEDLGDCYVKGLDEPVRAYRLGPAAALSPLLSLSERRQVALKPVIAVLPFECRVGYDPGDMLGEALAEEVIMQLARATEMEVISGLSTRRLKGRTLPEPVIAQQLDATLLLSGGYRMSPDKVVLNVRLQNARDGIVLAALHYETSVQAAFDPASPLADRIVEEVGQAIFRNAIQRSASLALPALESYALLFGAIGLMHRATAREFERARQMLEHLAHRQGGNGIAQAWLAKWHVLRVVQGWAEDGAAEARQALDHVERSLAMNPHNALALAIGGLVHGYLRKDLQTAGRMYDAALADNPCEPLAWLFSATRNAYIGDGSGAEEAGDMALRLSPIDPLRYFFDSLAATAIAGNGNFQRSVELAQRSVKANRTHASTWRTLAYALVMLGRLDEARAAVAELLRLEPGLTVQRFRDRFPGRDGPMAEPWSLALKEAGVPD